MKESPLNNIKIASPCSADWNAMIGDERKRFCGDCKLNVYNLSGMTKSEAEQLVTETEGRLCVRFYSRADGTIITEDCPVGWAKLKKNLSRTATAAISLVIGLFGGLFAFQFARKPASIHTMGDIAPANSKLRIEEDPTYCPPSNYATMGNVAMGTPVPIRQTVGEIPAKIERKR